jgi:hypothetical protein
MTFCSDVQMGTVTPVNLIYRDSDMVKSKQIVYSNFKTRVWGLSTRCGNKECESLPGSLVYKCRSGSRGDGNHDWVGCLCTNSKCQWKSPYIKRPDWLQPMANKLFFMHDYPLTAAQRDIFSKAMLPPADDDA